jgi:hypothetical protein
MSAENLMDSVASILIVLFYAPIIIFLLIAKSKAAMPKTKIRIYKKGEYSYKFWPYPFAMRKEAIYFTIKPSSGNREDANSLALEELQIRLNNSETTMLGPLVPCN